MSVTDRALLAFFAFSTVLLAGALLTVVLGWMVPFTFFKSSLLIMDYRLAYGVILGILILVAFRFLVISLKTSSNQSKQAIISLADLGAVSITMPALENMVSRAARQVKGVREVRPGLKYEPDGLVIKLSIVVNPDQNLPELTKSLQERVYEYIVTTAGLKVSEIKVRVTGIYQEGLRRVE
ncbi:MAG: hypothetical protein PWP31_45 [Clostridia bacterium]|nr:hypothetical protein [Clostridia bacterium]